MFLPSCAERPDIDETEETEEETEYVPPEKDYLTKLAENKGYQDYPDSIHCYTKPLIDLEDYCDKSELTFDTSQPEDGRFLSCSYRYQLEITSSQGGFVTENANSNYLTACGTTVTAHTLSLNGDIRRSETVFDETVHSPGQALFNIQKYGNSILAVTAVPPTLSGYSYTYHKYHIADGEVIEIAEGNTNTVYLW